MTVDDPEFALSLSYARESVRPALAAIFALDEALGNLLRTTREPALGQIRLAWWRERLEGLDSGAVPAEPVLQGLANEVLPKGVKGADLAGMVAGWEVLIEEETLTSEALARFAAGRGLAFDLGGRVLGAGPSDPLTAAGKGWALADLARNLESGEEAEAARALAQPLLHDATSHRWSRNARALGALAHLSRMDLQLPPGEPAPAGSPSRVGRLLWHRLSGR